MGEKKVYCDPNSNDLEEELANLVMTEVLGWNLNPDLDRLYRAYLDSDGLNVETLFTTADDVVDLILTIKRHRTKPMYVRIHNQCPEGWVVTIMYKGRERTVLKGRNMVITVFLAVLRAYNRYAYDEIAEKYKETIDGYYEA